MTGGSCLLQSILNKETKKANIYSVSNRLWLKMHKPSAFFFRTGRSHVPRLRERSRAAPERSSWGPMRRRERSLRGPSIEQIDDPATLRLLLEWWSRVKEHCWLHKSKRYAGFAHLTLSNDTNVWHQLAISICSVYMGRSKCDSDGWPYMERVLFSAFKTIPDDGGGEWKNLSLSAHSNSESCGLKVSSYLISSF